ncbi:MAG: selenocysteine-specific translation elongation factor [Pyrinomonadaceae bacterium]
MDVIVGTAGHIDHGKTALVKALTGVDADRLPEEKRRGITVDLGFAELSIGDVHLGFVDVPGHERFVKNMLAGAGGIDIVILVIAADEGVMPQTREHFAICRLLGIDAGIVALTKTDLVDAETLELAKLDAADLVAGSFLENAPVVEVSSKTGAGMDQLIEAIGQKANSLPERNDQFATRLAIDRSFSMKGFGAIVTGTLASGEIREGAEMELFPAGKRVRVRGLQTHGRIARSATAGQRTAVNLGGIDHSAIVRGMTLAEPGTMRPTQIVDTEIEILPDAARPLRSRQRVRVHIGTAEVLARIQILNETGEIAAGERAFAQLRLETRVVAIPGERFIIRRYSPQTTIGGGRIVNALAEKHRRKDFEIVTSDLRDLTNATGDNAAIVKLFLTMSGPKGLNFHDLQIRTGLQNEILNTAIQTNITAKAIVAAGGYFVGEAAFAALRSSTEKTLTDFHNAQPIAKGMPRENLRNSVFAFLPDDIFQAVIASLENIVAENDTIRMTAHRAEFSPEEIFIISNLRETYRGAGLAVPSLSDALAAATANTSQARKLFQTFLDSGEIIKVTEDLFFERTVIEKLVGLIQQYGDKSPDRTIDVSKFKELAGVSRKYAIPLLEYFDRRKITQRVGDKRIILK